MTPQERLEQQVTFLVEVDKLKSVLRATPIADGSRLENSGEHSWHIALYALILADQAGPDVSIDRVIKMLLIHDIVEIDAGDHPIYGSHDDGAQDAAEQAAADRLFGLLPEDQAKSLRALWDEFEAATSADAKFAKALDRFQPPLQNLASKGGSWADYDVTLDKVEARVGPEVKRGAPALWAYLHPRLTAFFK